MKINLAGLTIHTLESMCLIRRRWQNIWKLIGLYLIPMNIMTVQTFHSFLISKAHASMPAMQKNISYAYPTTPAFMMKKSSALLRQYAHLSSSEVIKITIKTWTYTTAT